MSAFALRSEPIPFRGRLRQEALELKEDGMVFCVGSLYLIGEIKASLREESMLNYEEELKKFKPSLDVDEVENAIYNQDLTDVIDLIRIYCCSWS